MASKYNTPKFKKIIKTIKDDKLNTRIEKFLEVHGATAHPHAEKLVYCYSNTKELARQAGATRSNRASFIPWGYMNGERYAC